MMHDAPVLMSTPIPPCIPPISLFRSCRLGCKVTTDLESVPRLNQSSSRNSRGRFQIPAGTFDTGLLIMPKGPIAGGRHTSSPLDGKRGRPYAGKVDPVHHDIQSRPPVSSHAIAPIPRGSTRLKCFYSSDQSDGDQGPKEHWIVCFLRVAAATGMPALPGVHLCSSEWPSVKLGGSPPRRALNPQECE